MFYATDFSYNGTSLSSIDPDLVIASLDDGANSDVNLIDRTVNRSAITYDEPFTHDYGVVDNKVLGFTITLINMADGVLSPERIDKIISWVMSPKSPRWLELYETDCAEENKITYSDNSLVIESRDDINLSGDSLIINNDTMSFDGQSLLLNRTNGLCYIGRFISAKYETIADAYKIGITLHFECSSPYPYTSERSFEFTNGSVTITKQGTFVGKSITPTIFVNPNGEGDITINNTNDDSQGEFKLHVDGDAPIKIENLNVFYYDDGEWKILPFKDHVLTYNWPMIVDGENNFVMTGDATGRIVSRFYNALGV